MKSKIGKILLFVLIIAVLLGAYTFLFPKKSATPSGTTLGSTTGAASIAGNSKNQSSQIGREFLTTLLNLKSISLDESIFASAGFTSLQDFTNPVSQTDPQGRLNPFAPIGLDFGPPVSTSTTTQTSVGNGATATPPTQSSSPSTPDTSGSQSPSPVTGPATAITQISATLHGAFPEVTSGTHLFEWGTTTQLGTLTSPSVSAGPTWSKIISGLTPNTSYSFRAVAKVGSLTFYGDTLTFTTLP